MTDVPRYATLRDYIRVLRRNRIVILVAVVLFGVGGYLLTAGQAPLYRAQASDAFSDVDLQTANLVGVSAVPTNSAATRAQINAATLTRPAVVATVHHFLPRVPRRLLVEGVSASVDTQNGFLIIQAESTNPVFAQQLANAYARAVAVQERTYARDRYTAAAAHLEQILHQPAAQASQTEQTDFGLRVRDLQFQAQTANPVQVVGNAAAPTAPISPHSMRDALLGILLGLTLGIGIAFARDVLDTRPRGSQEITEEAGWPILAHIREQSLGRVGFIRAAGTKVEDADLEGFRVLRQNLQHLGTGEPPRTVIVTSAKPEEGKSTVAASLACASALTGKLTLLIDCDLRRPTLARKLGVEAEPGLTDYLLGDAQPADILRTIQLAGVPTGSANGNGNGRAAAHVAGSQLVVIPAGRATAYPAELLGSQRLKRFLAEVSAAYDLVVIDSSPVLPVADALELVPEAQATILCIRASRTSAGELRALRDALERLPPRPTGVVITGARSGSEPDFGYYAQKYQYQ